MSAERPFENQPNIEAQAPTMLVTAEVPVNNELMPPHEQDIEEDAIIGLEKKLHEHRQIEVDIATNTYRAEVQKTGPYHNGMMVQDPMNPKNRIRRDPASLKAEHAKELSDSRQSIVAELQTLAGSGNTKRIKELLAAQAGVIGSGKSNVEQSHSDASHALALAEQADGESSRAYHRQIRTSGYAPETAIDAAASIKKPATQYGAAGYDERQRQAVALSNAGENSLALRSAQAGHASSSDARAWTVGHVHRKDDGTTETYLGSYANSINAIVDEATRELERHRVAAETNVRGARTELDGWDMRTARPNTAGNSTVESYLDAARTELDQLSPRDGDRAELVKLANQQRFRQEQRNVTERSNASGSLDTYRSFYTDDGGIFVRTPGGERIIYEDGSSARLQGTEYVRTHADGRPWTDEAPVVVLDVNTAGQSPSQINSEKELAFGAWETTRDPDAKGKAIGHLDASVSHLGGRANGLTETNNQLATEARNIDDTITSHGREIASLDAAVADRDNRINSAQATATAEIDKIQLDIDALRGSGGKIGFMDKRRITKLETQQAELRTQVLAEEQRLKQQAVDQDRRARALEAEIPTLQARQAGILTTRNGNLGRIESLRDRENKDMYWLGALQSEPVPPVGSPARIGYTALTGAVEMPPHLQADGDLVWNNRVINGVQGRWIMKPDGRSMREDDGFSNLVDANGRPVPPAEQIPLQRANTYYHADGRKDMTITADGRRVTYNRDGSIDTIS